MRASRWIVTWMVGGALPVLLAGCGGVHRSGEDRLADARTADRLGHADAEVLLAEAATRRAEFPDEPYWPYRMARVHLARGEKREAMSSLGDALRLDRTYEPALLLLSKVYFDRGRHQEAVDLIEGARRASAGDGAASGLSPRLAAALALHHDAMEAWADADAIVDALEDPASAGVGSALAYVALKGEDPARASAHAEAALAGDDDSAVNLNNLAVSRLRAGDPVAAREALSRAIERDPDLASPYYNLAVTELFFFLDRERAAEWFRKYRERADGNGPADVFDPDGLAGMLGDVTPERLAAADGDEHDMPERTTP